MSPRRIPPVLLVFALLAGTLVATGYSLRHEQAQAVLGAPPVVLATGLCITLIALALAVTRARRNRYTQREVEAATAELRASRRSHLALVENSPDVVTRLDGNLRFLYANAAIGRMTGQPPEVFVGRNLDEVGLADDVVAAMAAAVLDAFETGAEAELSYEIITPEGLMAMHARLAPEPGPDGGVESVLVISRDAGVDRPPDGSLEPACIPGAPRRRAGAGASLRPAARPRDARHRPPTARSTGPRPAAATASPAPYPTSSRARPGPGSPTTGSRAG